MAILLGTGKKARDFQIQVPCLDQDNNEISNTNQIILEPRYTDGSTAASKTFTASGDYADASNHNSKTTGWSYDVKLNWHNSGTAWYNYTYDTNSGRRGAANSPNRGTSLNDYGNYISFYVDFAVGDAPHPTVGNSYAHMAILTNAWGAHHHNLYSGATPNYALARTFPEHGTGQMNFKIAGQNYGTHYYRQWYCVADMQAWAHSNVSYLRFINWGGGASSVSRVRICGAAFIVHGIAGANSGADN
mgnify:CR=1 FL=1